MRYNNLKIKGTDRKMVESNLKKRETKWGIIKLSCSEELLGFPYYKGFFLSKIIEFVCSFIHSLVHLFHVIIDLTNIYWEIMLKGTRYINF